MTSQDRWALGFMLASLACFGFAAVAHLVAVFTR